VVDAAAGGANVWARSPASLHARGEAVAAAEFDAGVLDGAGAGPARAESVHRSPPPGRGAQGEVAAAAAVRVDAVAAVRVDAGFQGGAAYVSSPEITL
jgi:hypothetical protein